jgi:SAM-dependent methyltransferase
MSNPQLSFGGKIPQNYEDFLGPFLFEPYALDLVARLDLAGGHKILELACGSGRVTRHLSDKMPKGADFTASDLNADMINVAQNKVKADNVKWLVADMLAIPFEDNTFDLIVCQFGIMLVPNHLKALSEIFRVLKNNGKVIFSTWADLADNELWSISDKVLHTYLAKSTIQSNPGPFSMADQYAVIDLLNQVGFNAASATLVKTKAEIETAGMAAYGFIHGLPVSSFIQQENPGLLSDIIKAFEKQLIDKLGDFPLVVPQQAFLFEAIKP